MKYLIRTIEAVRDSVDNWLMEKDNEGADMLAAIVYGILLFCPAKIEMSDQEFLDFIEVEIKKRAERNPDFGLYEIDSKTWEQIKHILEKENDSHN